MGLLCTLLMNTLKYVSCMIRSVYFLTVQCIDMEQCISVQYTAFAKYSCDAVCGSPHHFKRNCPHFNDKACLRGGKKDLHSHGNNN